MRRRMTRMTGQLPRTQTRYESPSASSCAGCVKPSDCRLSAATSSIFDRSAAITRITSLCGRAGRAPPRRAAWRDARGAAQRA